MIKKHLIVLSSPSGGGKSTVAKYILEIFSQVRFSVSATTRSMRSGEIDGVHYHFLKRDEFTDKINKGELIEYEEIFGNYYGTLRSEIENALNRDSIVLFDVDVKGAMSIHSAYPDESLLIFIAPPDEAALETRLRNRGTETEEQLAIRLARTKMEITYSNQFDYVVVNNILDDTFKKVSSILLDNCCLSAKE